MKFTLRIKTYKIMKAKCRKVYVKLSVKPTSLIFEGLRDALYSGQSNNIFNSFGWTAACIKMQFKI